MRYAYVLVTGPTLEPITLPEAKLQARITGDDSNGVLLGYIKAARNAAEDALGRGLLTQTWRLDLSEWTDEIFLPMAAPLQHDGAIHTIVSNTLASPTVVTTADAHGFTTGQAVTIAGNSGSVPTINGSQVVTVISDTTFSIVVNCSTGGTGGTVVLTTPVTAPVVKYYDTDGTLQTLATTVYDVDTVSQPGRLTRAANQTWPSLQSGRVGFPIQVLYTVGWTSPTLIPDRIKQGIRSYVTYLDSDRDGLALGADAARVAAELCWSDRVHMFPLECV